MVEQTNNSQSFNFRQTKFILSAPDIKSLPQDNLIEIAFVGRSNAGKSSALNCLTDQKSLARTSKTPGRTQLINLFQVIDEYYLVDLPGYGFAAVPEQVKLKWQKSLGEYLKVRKSIKGLVLLMDIRHPLKDLDQQMLSFAVESKLPVLLLLTKADKVSQKIQSAQVKMVREAILPFMGDVSVEAFSSTKRTGLPKLRNWLSDKFLANLER